MKRVILCYIAVLITITTFANGGREYFLHVKGLYDHGRYEEAIQGFENCKKHYSDELPKENMDKWIAKCNKAINDKKIKTEAARKAAAAQKAAYAAKQRLREERNLIFISTNARTLSANYSSMQSAIKGKLQQFHFAMKEDDAKWAIYITADTRESPTPLGPKIHIDAICQIVNLLTYETIFEQEYSTTGAFSNTEASIKKAYKDLIEKISEDITNTL